VTAPTHIISKDLSSLSEETLFITTMQPSSIYFLVTVIGLASAAAIPSTPAGKKTVEKGRPFAILLIAYHKMR
jgi:hypothetical protein